ncbi:MAG: T9SS type A sorting domain-containing protein [Bacteroidetes bacterium]|nr:T9SS type A sorting domain-containing protein [Bacteroidota bacterium]
MKKLIISIISFLPIIAFSQSGIVNKGAIIKVQNGSYLVAESQYGHLKISDNAAIPGKVINEGVVTISGNWTNNATYRSTLGTVVFKGANTSINGTAITNFSNLKINKTASSNNVLLNSNIIVNSNLVMTSGDLYLNNKNADLGLTGIIQNETNSNKIWDDYINGTGTISVTRNNITPVTGESFGNIGIIITSNQSLGNTLVTRGHKQQLSTSPAGSSIYRYFDIAPANNTGLNATLRFTYFDEEIPSGMSESDFALYNSDNLGITWVYEEGIPNPASNYLQKTGINEFSRWTATDQVTSPLPVELLNFTIHRENSIVHLYWKTISERNNKGFEIEKSIDLNSWEKIGFVVGAGNSNAELNYKFDDELSKSILSKNKNVYYRLKQIDYDGAFVYSEIKTVYIENQINSEFEIEIYPNPATNYVNIVCNTPEKHFFIKLTNQEGITVGNYKALGNIYIDLSNLSPTTYNIIVFDPETGKYLNKKIVKL